MDSTTDDKTIQKTDMIWVRVKARRDLHRLVRLEMVRLGQGWETTAAEALALWLKAAVGARRPVNT